MIPPGRNLFSLIPKRIPSKFLFLSTRPLLLRPFLIMAYSQVSGFTDQFSETDFLQSDDLPTLSNTCRTATSVALSDPRQSSQQLAPSSLKRIGPRFHQIWILYDTNPEMEQSRLQFTEWWLQTEFGVKKDAKASIGWDNKKRSSVWDEFDQVAHEKTGEPKIICKRCHTILTHPQLRRGGTSPMNTHLKSTTCKPGLQRRGIDQLLLQSVSLNIILFIYHYLLTLFLFSPRLNHYSPSLKIFLSIIFSSLLLLPDSHFVYLNTLSSNSFVILFNYLLLRLSYPLLGLFVVG